MRASTSASARPRVRRPARGPSATIDDDAARARRDLARGRCPGRPRAEAAASNQPCEHPLCTHQRSFERLRRSLTAPHQLRHVRNPPKRGFAAHPLRTRSEILRNLPTNPQTEVSLRIHCQSLEDNDAKGGLNKTRDSSASGGFRWNKTRACTSTSACPRASTTQRGFAAIPVSAAAAAAAAAVRLVFMRTNAASRVPKPPTASTRVLVNTVSS